MGKSLPFQEVGKEEAVVPKKPKMTGNGTQGGDDE
jgi:hypothetical protein